MKTDDVEKRNVSNLIKDAFGLLTGEAQEAAMYIACVHLTFGLGAGYICNAYVHGSAWAIEKVSDLIVQAAKKMGKK